MKLTVDEITEVKVVAVDVDKEFIYFDKLPDGSWRMTYTKNLNDRFVLHERTPNATHDYLDAILRFHKEKKNGVS